MLTLTDVLLSLMDSCLLLFFVQYYFCMVNNQKRILKYVAIVVATSGTMLALQPIVTPGSGWLLLASTVVFVVLCKTVFKEQLHSVLLWVLFGLVIIGLIEVGVLALSSYFLKTPVESVANDTGQFIYLAITAKIVTLSVMAGIHKIPVNAGLLKTRLTYQLILLIVIDLILILVGGSFYKYTNLSAVDLRLFTVAMAVGIIVFSYVVLSIISKIIRMTEREQAWQHKESGYQEQLKHVRELDDFSKQLRFQRHEYGNQLQCLYGLLSVGDMDSARSYLGEMFSHMEELDRVVNAENPVLSSLLNVKHTIATEKGIKVKYDIAGLHMERVQYVDLTIIIGNLMDNAIEACGNLERSERYITLKVYPKHANVCIVAENSKSAEIRFQKEAGYTSKADKTNHGIGIENIRHVVEKYQGHLKIEDRGASFIAQIALPDRS